MAARVLPDQPATEVRPEPLVQPEQQGTGPVGDFVEFGRSSRRRYD